MGETAIHQGEGAPRRKAHSLYSMRLAEKRIERRARVHVRVVHPISTPQLVPDPLVRHTSPLRSTARATRVLVSAVALHGGVLIGFLLLNRFMGDSRTIEPRAAVQVEINEVAPAPPPPVEEEEEVEEGPIVDDFEQETPPPEPPPTQHPHPWRQHQQPQPNPNPNPKAHRLHAELSD